MLVVDWMLRDRVNGIEVAVAMRRHRPKLGVVVITGYCSLELRAQMDELAAAQCLEKPFSPDELLAAVRAWAG